ncbi:uncharacterized protein LOC124138512 [Haliotis rufescens]|uniref:uncharacterized protein LOC124138512 n=1 Tax=Haliotis rufescens TaxID=6454 RepID=UPI00201ED7C2|nr:uncharacterized protein LOC124138512 [Haliotis rufescens]XP_048249387.1 uncharacterized protein LOC124138512 [Haliotis rufescens]
MGRRDKSVLTTYGRHRNRVVATDVWSSDEDKKKHVFSFSSGGSINLSSAESDVSLLDLSKKVPVTKRKTTAKNTKNTKTQKTKGVNKENRYIKKNGGNKKGKKFAVFSETEKDSCSSTGGESLVFSVKAVNQRVLRDRNGLTDSSMSTGSPASKRRTRRHKQKATNKKKDDLSYNFSEFDDYSLVVLSGTPQSANKKPKNKALTSGIETSTPFRDAKKNSHIVEKIKDPNISLIDLVEDSPFVSDLHSSLQDSPHSLSDMTGITSSYGASPSLVVSSNAAKRSDRNNSPHLSVDKNMKTLKDRDVKLLQESVQNLHISDRSWRRGDQGDASTTSALDSFQQSQSLFDSSIEARSSHLSRNVSDSSRQISPNSCVVQLQKMRDSLLRSQLSDNVFSPLRTNIHKTRSISKETENVISGRKLRSQNVDTGGDECCPKVDLSLVDKQGGEEYSTDYSTEEDEEEEDLSDIYEDEEDEDEDSSAGGIDETKYSLTDNVVSGDWSVEMVSGYLSEVKEMDMSVGSLQGLQKSVYYSAESDGSFYRTAEGSSAVHQDRRVKDRKKNKHLEKTFDDGNMSRSFVEMLTPNKKSQSSPPLSPRSKLFQMCEQKAPVTFQDVIPDNMMKKIVKIGEGVYGEVFRADRSGNSVAIKIIPIEGNFEVNDEPQKTFSEILPEVVISTELSGLRLQGRNTTPNFCRVNSVACVQGRYPDHLLAQWDIYNKKRKSENDRPDIFDENQLFILFEFADGGSDLESFQFAHPWQAKSILQQVSVSLAVAEEQLEFEHRDLHIGNVLVRSNSTDDNITYRLADGVVETESHGVMVSIIDFTLSRLRKDGCTVFCDISKDDSLFEGTGDYQFDIYRNMKIENKNEWEPFNPHSNILWLHYLVDKLLKQKRYKRNSREDREAMRYLRQFQAEVLQFTSCKHLVLESHLFQT